MSVVLYIFFAARFKAGTNLRWRGRRGTLEEAATGDRTLSTDVHSSEFRSRGATVQFMITISFLLGKTLPYTRLVIGCVRDRRSFALVTCHVIRRVVPARVAVVVELAQLQTAMTSSNSFQSIIEGRVVCNLTLSLACKNLQLVLGLRRSTAHKLARTELTDRRLGTFFHAPPPPFLR